MQTQALNEQHSKLKRRQVMPSLAGKAPSTLLTITLAAIHSKQTLESLVEFRDYAKTRDVSTIN